MKAREWLSLARLRWFALSPREQRLALGCAAFVAAALAWSLHDWQGAERQRLRVALVKAETRLKTMQALVDEYQNAQSAAKNAGAPTAAADELLLSMKAKGLELAATPGGGTRLELKGNVRFDQLVEWLAQLHGRGWRAERLSATRLADAASSGIVRVEATLAVVGQ